MVQLHIRVFFITALHFLLCSRTQYLRWRMLMSTSWPTVILIPRLRWRKYILHTTCGSFLKGTPFYYQSILYFLTLKKQLHCCGFNWCFKLKRTTIFGGSKLKSFIFNLRVGGEDISSPLSWCNLVFFLIKIYDFIFRSFLLDMAIVSNATHDRKHADTALETYVTITLTGCCQH